MKDIIEAIKQKYNPIAIIAYGSYVDGSNGPDSDFDAMVITRDGETVHDTSFVHGVQLDVFIYPREVLQPPVDCNHFLQITTGKVVLDTDGVGEAFFQMIQQFTSAYLTRSKEDLAADVAWCRKMLLRTQRNDAEGMYRWHWLLTESLQIYCDIKRKRYLGPKKTLKWMQIHNPKDFELYRDALFSFTYPTLSSWVARIEDLWAQL